MAANSAELHESADRLSSETIDRHRAIVSLMEELEAIDWYDQRLEAADDPDLVEILIHNRDEEKEHAALTLEWLRRRDPVLDEQLRLHLFTDPEPIAARADAHEEGGGAAAPPARGSGSLDIGTLKGVGAL